MKKHAVSAVKILVLLSLSIILVFGTAACKNGSAGGEKSSKTQASKAQEESGESGAAASDTGSGGPDVNSAGTSSQSTSAAGQSSGNTGTASGNTGNLGGRKVKVLVLGQGTAYPNPDSESYERNVKRIAYVENKYNCKLVFNTDHSFPEINDYIVNNVASGKDFADVAWAAPWYVASPYVTQNIAVPLDEYIDFGKSTLSGMKLQNWGKFFGKHFTLATGNGGTNCILLYNKDIFKASNGKLEDPYTLMKNGQWTWDKFLEIAQKATVRDTSGKVTQWGVVTVTGGEFLSQIMASNNVSHIEYNGEKFTMNYADKKLTEVLNFCNKIVNEYKCGLLSTGVIEAKVDGTKDWKQGKAAMAFSTLGLAKTYAPANCGMVLAPRGPSADKHYAPAYGGTGYMVPVTSKIPSSAAKIMYDLFADWDTSMPGAMDAAELAEFKSGSKSYDLAFGENDFDTLSMTISNARLSYGYYFSDVGNSFENTVFSKVIYSNMSVSTALDTYKPTAQLLIDRINTDLAAAKKKYKIN